ncbi:MAG TPA: AraC family transcriptional regulator [Roseiarcus sp.]|nr:AraC family transcriptional regulator [Roseiarcus sp.]
MNGTATSHTTSFRTGSSYSLPDVIRSHGQSAEAVFDAAEVDIRLYSHPENRIGVADLGRLFTHAARATEREDIGLLVVANFRPGGLGLVGELAAEGPDVGTAVRNLVRLLQYNTLAGYPTLSVHDRIATLGFDLRNSDFAGANFVLEGATGIIFRFMQWLCGKDWTPEDVHLSRRAPADPRPFNDFFGAPVRFSATEDAVLFSADWLTRQVAREEHRRQSRRLEIATAPFSELVRRQVAIRLGLKPVDAAALADALGMSRRQLFRRLKSEGASCRTVVDDVRFSRARHFLEVGDAPIADIAFALAFPDQSSFTRAFRRMSGRTPAEWRSRR